jgi:hypothetical protein
MVRKIQYGLSTARRLKRGGNCEMIFLDAQDAESRYLLESGPRPSATPTNPAEVRRDVLGLP